MKSLTFLLIAAVTLLPSVSRGQGEYSEQSVFSDYLSLQQPAGFLHIPGLEFYSSMGFTFFSSEGFGSGGMGYYLGHFNLRLSSSLTLRWDVGLRSMFAGPENNEAPEFFLPNIDLTYRPSDKFLLRFQFQQYGYPSRFQRRRY